MIVLDSSFIIAFHNERDVHHERAVPIMSRLMAGEWEMGLLPEYIFLEVVTVLAARRNIDTATRVGDVLLNARELRFVPCSELFLDAYELFRAQPRAKMSLADAAIVAAARRFGAANVATFDTDFAAIEGLTMVPD